MAKSLVAKVVFWSKGGQSATDKVGSVCTERKVGVREVREILEAFRGNHRVIVGAGDQVGRETPEENLRAMIAAVMARPG